MGVVHLIDKPSVVVASWSTDFFLDKFGSYHRWKILGIWN